MHHRITNIVHHVTSRLPEKKRQELNEKLDELHRRGIIPSSVFQEANKIEEDPKDPFPDLSEIPVEDVTKRWYDWDSKQWKVGPARIRIHPEKFAEGGMREAHFMLLVNPDGGEERMVAKKQKGGKTDPESYDTDVVMQAACQTVAKAFNGYNPVKHVEFIDCFVIQRKDQSWWGIETYLMGKYVKYNNNYGYVGRGSRNTPQAFSHFSYEFTQGKLMIVDIQGVDDKYTDPQIHTADGKGFGQGNIGVLGMERFLKSHWCNPICTSLGLPFHAPRKFGVQIHHSAKDSGTMHHRPQQGPIENAKVSDFIGDIQPKKGGASAEDLALLGLDLKTFNKLVELFNHLDKDQTGFLNKDELYTLFQKAKVAETKTKEMEEFVAFASRVERQLNSDGRISFKSFLLCWTDNV